MIRLNSSLRVRDAASTLALAKTTAARLGISRVTDITRLDAIGIPVFTSVRPGATPGSLCVNAGKGILPIEAQVGAYMEAIEFALAEPRAFQGRVELLTGRAVLDGDERPDALFDFCPVVRRPIDVDAPLACVQATDIVRDVAVNVPAELVLLPYLGVPGTGNFGSNSNGLASGNSREEAILHGLLELIERDIRSFQRIDATWRRISPDTLPPVVRTLLDDVTRAGLRLCVRSCDNPFGLAFFEATLYDPFARAAQYLNGGYGCHLIAEVALVRAVTEAVQSRLSWIHGGRDDLEDLARYVTRFDAEEVARETSEQFDRLEATPQVPFAHFPDASALATSVEDALAHVVVRVLDAGMSHVCVVPLTDGAEPLQVVRVLVPRLEYLDSGSNRAGPRLRERLRVMHAASGAGNR
jgi:ribosomal protein S12 methylthiotransferase accessory factor